jgi:16S rRNA (adenine1518-N6/adenine1519-N6)-dimethyltransferase
MPNVRQTQSYLRGLFARHGVSPQRRLGQNFLIDLNLHDLIVSAAAVGPGDLVLEVGPGAGALTSLMAARGATVAAIEVDPAMARLASEAVAGLPQVRILNVDVLRNKNSLNPAVIDVVKSGLAAEPGRPFKLVANLPYNVATPVISNLLVHPDLRPDRMVVTIQRELADRMVAAPSTSAYGSLSVVIQALAEVSLVRILPPSVFWPRPKVESAIVSVTPDPVRRAAVGDVAWFHGVVRRTFLHRRKNLRHVLAGMWPDRWTKHDVDTWLEEQGFTGQLRAEALSVDEFIQLSKALQQRWGTISATDPVDENPASDTATASEEGVEVEAAEEDLERS